MLVKHLFYPDDKILNVGMKGMPGRGGVVRAHNPGFPHYKDDTDDILKQWIPNDYEVYLNMGE